MALTVIAVAITQALGLATPTAAMVGAIVKTCSNKMLILVGGSCFDLLNTDTCFPPLFRMALTVLAIACP